MRYAQNRVFLISVVVVFLIAARTHIAAQSSPKQRSEYETWVQSYRKLHLGAFDNPKFGSGLLRITAIEGDDLPPAPGLFGKDRVVAYGCTVSNSGTVSYFQYTSWDMKGSGYPVIPAQQLNQLKSILDNLPDDHSWLPPPGRRLVFQVAMGSEVLVRIYDRANLPDRILDAMAIVGAGIEPWTRHFAAQKTGTAAEFQAAPIHVPSYLSHSPDGTLEVAQGNYEVVVTTVGQPGYHELKEPEVNRHYDSLFGAIFSPDGRYLLLQSSRPAVRIFDTKTWEPVATLPGMPTDVVGYYPDTDWKRAVFVSSTGRFGLWDPITRREIANLGSAGKILDVSFSPDCSLVAVAFLTKANDSSTFHTRIWDLDGTVVSELRFAGQIEPPSAAAFGDYAGMLRWWRDSQYLITIVRPHGFFTARNVALWNVHSGRYSGDLAGCPTSIDRFAVDPETGRVFAECYLQGLLMWDTASAIKQTTEFERTLIHEP